MILVTYWYFGFPSDLYHFDYFEFRRGYGGHAGSPAELFTTIETEQPDKIISELRELIQQLNEGFIFIYQDGQKLKIGTGSHQLFDYDFSLITQVEKILKKQNVKLLKGQKFDNSTYIRIQSNNSSNKIIYPKKGLLQIVGSELKKQNSENIKLRLDCNLPRINKNNFITELKKISVEERIDIFFYYENDLEDKTNLMLFFTNGRQGLNLTEKIFINIVAFENKVEQAILRNQAIAGLISGFDFYPKNGPKIEMMIEEDYII